MFALRENLATKLLFFSMFSLFTTLLFQGEAVANTKHYSRIFKVVPNNASLTLYLPSGSIVVHVWDRPEIKVNATLKEDTLELREKEVNSSIELEVHCSKAGPAEFEVSVPAGCTLDLKCLKGSIEINAAQGRILAQTTEGPIDLRGLQSANVTAKSISGPINYQGILDSKGIYNFHSVENTVDIMLPANSGFVLMATAVAGKIDLGGFQLSEAIPQDKRISGKHGGGGASLNLSTHRGQVRLHKMK